MRQATVNLFADMGVQPGTLQPGLTAATASTDTHAADRRRSPRPGPATPSLTGSRRDDHRHRGRHRRRPGRRRRGLDRRRASGIPRAAASTGATRSLRRRRGRADDPQPRDRRQREHGRRVGRGRRHGRAAATTAARARCGTTRRRRRSPADNDGSPIEIGDALHERRRRHDHRAPVLQGRGQHRHAHRPPLDGRRHAARDRRRSRARPASGWQEVALATPVAITAGHALHRVVLLAVGLLRVQRRLLRRFRRRQPAAPRAAGHRRAPNGVYNVRHRAGFPTTGFNGSNYWVDVVFETGPDTTAPVDHDARRRPRTRRDVALGSTVRVDVRRCARPGARSNAIVVRAARRRERARAGDRHLRRPAPTTAMLTPSHRSHRRPTYTATVHGGAGGVTDAARTPLAADVTWSFTDRAHRRPTKDRVARSSSSRARPTRSAATSPRSCMPKG